MNPIETHLAMQIMRIGILIEIVNLTIVKQISGAPSTGLPTTRRRSADRAARVTKDRRIVHNKTTDLTSIVGIIE